MMGKFLAFSIGLGTLIIIFAATYLVVAGLTYLICLGFGLTWSWLLALGVWALIVLLKIVISGSLKKE